MWSLILKKMGMGRKKMVSNPTDKAAGQSDQSIASSIIMNIKLTTDTYKHTEFHANCLRFLRSVFPSKP